MNPETTSFVRFPLDGEWMALRTPASGVPSHGTQFLGQSHAYDFVRPTGRRLAPFGPTLFAHAYGLVRAESFAAWGASVRSVAAGRVVAAKDRWPDRRRLNGIADLIRMAVFDRFRTLRIAAEDWRPLTGNYVLVESAIGVALYAHLQQGSLCVQVGDEIAEGTLLGRVGNSGRSSMPHLHFHLMDRADGLNARGLPCAITAYERREGTRWLPASGVPRLREHVRMSGTIILT